MVAAHIARLTAVAALAAVTLAACSPGVDSAVAGTAASSAAGGCPDVVASATTAVAAAVDPTPAWAGPTTGPKAATGKQIVYVAQTLTDPGVAGAAKGVAEAATAIGWTSRTIDGRGDQAGIQAAFGQALALRPAGIVVGGFDANSITAQIAQANAANIPIVGWHALPDPGPSTDPTMFSNVTTRVADVAEISAQWVIAESNGNAGVVLFTDNSMPFAAGKATMLEAALKTCNTVKVLQVDNIPIPDAGKQLPRAFSSLVSKLGASWDYSVAIDDLYFDNAATPLRAAGKDGAGAPFNVAAGDGSAAAFQRIAGKQFQAATVPEPLNQEGWQIVDELNRAFNKLPASGYVPAVHVTDAGNVGTSTAWDPANGYRDAYKKIWGK